MIRKFFKSLYIPAVTIITVVLTLFIILVVSTNKNLNRQRDNMEQALMDKGWFAFEAVDVLLRDKLITGELLRAEISNVLENLAEDEDIFRIYVIDPAGILLTSTDPKGTEAPPGYEKRFQAAKMEGELVQVDREHGIIKLGRVISSYGIIVELDMKRLNRARKSDLKHALFMGIILLALGTASIYFVFVVQNYYIANRALEETTSYMENVVESMPDVLISVDSEGEIVTVNSAAKALLAPESGSLKGKHISEIVSPEQCDVFGELEDRGYALMVEGRVKVEGEENQVPISVSASRVRDSQGDDLGTVFIMRDLRELKTLQERVVRSEKLAVAGTLASGIAHEIRNPLSSIRGFAHYFKKAFDDGTREKEYFDLMIGEIDRLNRTINDLLNLARPKEPDIKRGDIAGAIRRAITVVSDKADDVGVPINLFIDENLPEIEFDQDQVHQVYLNLLLNAIDAAGDGGKIDVKAGREKRGGRCVVEVSDSGPGISEGDLSKIFDPFFTTKEGGTGLGLAIVNQIVEAHGWNIGVDSIAGKGTTFSLYIRVPRMEKIEGERQYGKEEGPHR